MQEANVKAYEYENAIHVTLPGLNQSSVELVGVREAYGPDLGRAVHNWSALHYCSSWNWGIRRHMKTT
jgi:hypothetical protein